MNKTTVTVIPATVSPNSFKALNVLARKRVAAYARVSTDTEEQLNSYAAQVDYYTKYIQSKPEWEFVKVFTDEGITATNTKRRDGFKDMVEDALNGSIDLIITKSVSRFARNTVDTLTTVRKLKEKGVEVYFEKENIYTLDSKGELLITIMSSLAQEESRSISENVTWGQRKRMADGKVSMAYKHFLGYTKGPDGTPQVVESEAAVVRRIYGLFLEGKTIREICNTLTAEGIPTPGGSAVWAVSTARSILQNEKYTGNALLQKRYTVDFLTKTTKVNEGEVPQYFVQGSHPAIIDLSTFELAQAEMKRRGALGKQFSGNGLFHCRVVCGDCGGFYGSKVWHSTDPYRKVVWLCNRKYAQKSAVGCHTPHLSEEQIQQGFVTAFNSLLADKSRYMAAYDAAAKKAASTSALDQEISSLQADSAAVMEAVQACVKENAVTVQNQEEYVRRYNELTAQYKAAKERLTRLEAEKQERTARAEQIRRFHGILSQTNPLTGFDPRLWCAAVDTVKVHSIDNIVVRFTGGTEVSVSLAGQA
jgi:DNA invertase Pin-like site-specific DNA recombinase